MAEGIDLIVKHDTELCADESGCGRDSWQHGLCKRHHQTAWSKGELPPQFKIYRSGHALGERNAAGLRWCAACRCFVEVYSVSSRHATKSDVCRNGVAERSREKTTGWSQVDYDLALIEQGNRCYLCGGRPSKERLHADHDHASGHRRHLLCRPCNTALGMLGDNPKLMRRAASYVEERHG